MNLPILVKILWVALAVSVGFFVYHLIRWLLKDQVFQIMGAKISGNMERAADLRRKAMQQKIRDDRSGAKAVKMTSTDKLYHFIGETGILDVFPGANEVSVLFGVILIVLLIGLIAAILFKSWIDGLIVAIVVVITIIQVSKTVVGHRKTKIDSELLPFINSCLSGSTGQSDIISIFQEIYPSMDEPIRSMLETCVAEANATNDKRKAIEHLRDKSPSDEFYSVINNLYICSETSGEYTKTIRTLSKTLVIYNNTLEKKKAILRNARMNGLLLAGLGGAALVACNGFYDGFLVILIHNPIGIALIAAMFLVAIFVLTISAD
jgi:tight adherence protein B